jgi:hypothetical protein
MKPKTLMIIGLGSLGGYLLEYLSREHSISKIIVGDINDEYGIRKTNLAIEGSSMMDYYPEIEFAKIDLFDVPGTAKLIKKYSPDIICNTTTLQSWWVVTTLPHDVYMSIEEAGFGPWVSMHLTLAKKMMEAVKKSGLYPFIINSSFPDAVNPSLSKIGLAPTVGLGNVDCAVPVIKLAMSKKLNIPIKNIKVYACGAHYWNFVTVRFGDVCGSPYYLKIIAEGNDVTKMFDFKDLLKYPRTGGAEVSPVVASSGAKIILSALNNSKDIINLPGPNGLPGGYPTRVSSEGVEVILPNDISLQEAIQINEGSNRCDGIEKIDEQGNIEFTEKSYRVMKDMIGYDCKVLEIDRLEEEQQKLNSMFKKFCEKYRK